MLVLPERCSSRVKDDVKYRFGYSDTAGAGTAGLELSGVFGAAVGALT